MKPLYNRLQFKGRSFRFFFSFLAEILKTSENELIIFWLEFEPDHYILYRDDVIPKYLTIIQTQIINQMVSLFIVLSYICIRLNGEYF